MVASPAVNDASSPHASLETFPFELLHMVVELLDQKDLLFLSLVSYRCLQQTAARLYNQVKVDMEGAVALLTSKVSLHSQ